MWYGCLAFSLHFLLFHQISNAQIPLPWNNVSGFKNLPCMSARIINALARRYQRTLSVSVDSYSPEHGKVTDILEDTFLCLNLAVPIFIYDKRIEHDRHRYHRYLNYLLALDSDSFIEAISHTKVEFDHTGYYVIALAHKPKDLYESLRKIFGIFRRFSIINVITLFESNDSAVEAWTYSPFVKDKRCNFIDLDYLGRSQKIPSTITRSKFFPKKAYNLRGCPLILACWQNAPYMILRKNCTGHIEISGIEGDFLNYMAVKRNFTIVVKEYGNEINPQGFVYKNGTATKALQWILDGKVNVSCGAYALSSLKSEVFSSTFDYMTEHNIFIVPVGKPISYFKSVFIPFQLELWVLLGICFIAASTLMFLLIFAKRSVVVFIYGYHVRYPILNMWIVSIGGTLYHLPGRNFSRFILMQWIILTFVLRTAYLAQLFKLQQRPPMTEQITELTDDLWKEGYIVFSDFQNYNMFVEFYPQGDSKIFSRMSAFEKNIEYYLEKLRDSEFKGIVLTTESRIDFQEMNITMRPLTRLSFGKLMFPLVFYFDKHSMLIESFDIEISKLKSSGIFARWGSRYRRRSILKKFLQEDEAKPLHILQIMSFLGYWVGGVYSSIVCLCLEHFWWRFGDVIRRLLRLSETL